VVAVAFLIAFVVNAQWLAWNVDRPDLRAGYFLWWLSFIAVAYAALRLSKGVPVQAQSDAAA
jgi:hypothetical protein